MTDLEKAIEDLKNAADKMQVEYHLVYGDKIDIREQPPDGTFIVLIKTKAGFRQIASGAETHLVDLVLNYLEGAENIKEKNLIKDYYGLNL